MKIYTYGQDIVSKFPEFKERPWEPVGPNVQNVDNPDEADFIICPVALHRIKSTNPKRRLFPKSQMPADTLPYWKTHESKHVFFDCSDFEVSLAPTSALLIRCNLRHWMKQDGRCFPWFWPVDDLGDELAAIPEDGFKYDVSFHGWLSTSYRKNCVASCQKTLGNRFDFKTFSDFFGHLPPDSPERIKRRKDFLDSVKHSRVLLCPQSIQGVFPYRFYEALSAGRIPALFCTGYNLPFQNEIDWDKCIPSFKAEEDKNAGVLIDNFLKSTSEARKIEMMTYGRKVWKEWLNRDRQPELMAYALQQILEGKLENEQR